MNNIIIDGNYLFYKTLFIFGNEGGKKVLESTKQQEEFIRKIATDMAFAIRQFGAPSRIIFTIDGRSWRKDVVIEENEGYKAHRKKESNIDWDSFFRCMNEFADVLDKQGMIVSRIDRAEGDDLMYLWTQVFLKKGENSIVITGDKDLHQLVRVHKNNYAVVYNPNSRGRKIYGAKGLEDWISEETEVSLFDTSSYLKTGKDLIRNAMAKIPMEELDPGNFLLKKILIGDDGDGVPSVFHWKSKNGKTTHRITSKRAEKILDYVRENGVKWAKENGVEDEIKVKDGLVHFSVFDLPDLTPLICQAVKSVTKESPDPEDLKKKIERNILLMVLHVKTIPNDITETFKDHVKEKIQLNTLPGRKYDVSVILEGTRFLKPPDSFTTGLFGALDKKK